MIKTGTGNGISLLCIEGKMTGNTVPAQKKELLQSQAKVEELDAAGLQLLLLVKMEAARSRKKVRVVEYSPAFHEIFNRYNLKRHFDAPRVLPSIA